MRLSRIILLALATLAAGSPLAARQDQGGIVITVDPSVYYPTVPTPLSPAEKARRDANAQQIAAEKLAFEQDVEVEINRLGPARADEARNLVKMRREAQAARPKPPAGKPPGQRPNCSNELVSWTAGGQRQPSTQQAAFRLAEDANQACMRETKSGANIQSSTCSKDELGMWERPPPIGNCLACITMAQAKALGLYPPAPPTYSCVAKISCQGLKEVCKAPSGGSAVSAQ